MPNKTIYVKDSELQLFEEIQEQLSTSLSSLFSEFLRERVANMNPAESRIASMIGQISARREAAQADRGIPPFINGGYALAEEYAKKSLRAIQTGKIRDAKILLWTASSYLDLTERNLKHVKDVNEKIAAMDLESST